MFCRKCGNELENNDKFCNKCGTKVTKKTNAVPITNTSNSAALNSFNNEFVTSKHNNTSSLKTKKYATLVLSICIIIVIFSIFSSIIQNTNLDAPIVNNSGSAINSSLSNASNPILTKPQNTDLYYVINNLGASMSTDIYSLDSSGNSSLINTSSFIYNIKFAKDAIYYLNSGHIFKSDLNGKNAVQIDNDPIFNSISKFTLGLDNKIYYDKSNSNMSDEILSRFARINTDGTGDTVIDKGIPNMYYADNSGIYLISAVAADGAKILHFDSSTLEKKYITQTATGYMTIYGDYIYYINITDNFKLYKVKKDGTEVSKLSDDELRYKPYDAGIYQTDGKNVIQIDGDYVYYSLPSDMNKIYKIKTDGTNKTKITDESMCTNLRIKDGCLYYISGGYLYNIKTDGTRKVKLLNKIIAEFELK